LIFRIFEGSFEQTLKALGRIAALPEDTLIYSGHNYAASILKFELLWIMTRGFEIEMPRSISTFKSE